MIYGDEEPLPICRQPEPEIADDDIPETFDARLQWPECQESLWDIRDQGKCASCWVYKKKSNYK
jgi:hypothetical protein